MLRFALNLFSQRNHVGGAIFNNHERLTPVLQKYLPALGIKQLTQISSYIQKVTDFIKNSPTKQNSSSFVIHLHYFENNQTMNDSHLVTIMNNRHLMMDFLYQEDDPSKIGHLHTTQTDYFLLKKQLSSNLLFFSKFFAILGLDETETMKLFDKTFKSDYVLKLTFEYFVSQRPFGGWSSDLININLFPQSFLSDEHFWYHLENLNPFIYQ